MPLFGAWSLMTSLGLPSALLVAVTVEHQATQGARMSTAQVLIFVIDFE